ncbi:glycosyltransferase [Leptolyngbya cf. ectocarpi LEGE 11479]|uniref:Glycosyltransferase n=1 Tax=Leptolyngbya cf. ectocarpi LEGE 11479 TaxID=1828722 RepID=A0A928ZYJ5_LEPEC|nr:glycosyltransferase family 1 protein [Leptolyngbya ectocarpi]MBE9069806.1 glycosyltransferase [Leptolyngbya cf. ectocarpi LEGE 11479]
MFKGILANGSELDKIIPPEIAEDAFYTHLVQLCQESSVKTILEIGSSAGQGSTKAFVSGIQSSMDFEYKKLFCIEVSRVRFEALKQFYKDASFVKCYNCSSVPIHNFPTRSDLACFYNSYETGLNAYSLDEVFRWLEQDITYVEEQAVPNEGIRSIKIENNISFFDLVLIDGSEFTGEAELDEVYGAKYICLDDINTFKNYENHNRLCEDENYDLVVEERKVRNGFSIFQRIGNKPIINNDIPVHFLTIVLNGQPFIPYHLNYVFKNLKFKWHWHIVEGVADLAHDTAWSLANGGVIDKTFHENGLSSDGTTEYLNKIAEEFPDNISIYRKEGGQFWDGKLEMVNAPLENINEECLLWQIDVDELWTSQQITRGREIFIEYPHKTAAFYWCHYFVGPNLIVSSRNCYSQNPVQEWLRTWRYQPGMRWSAHEPPILVQEIEPGLEKDVSKAFAFSHQRTEREGLVFQHFAYVLQSQLVFKEKYYGYQRASSNWERLLKQTRFPTFLRDYFDWVNDDTTVEKADSLGISPIFRADSPSKGPGIFTDFAEPMVDLGTVRLPAKSKKPTVLIDGVFFQLLGSGIGRVWRTLLEEWSNHEFGQHITVLDRNNSAPKIPGIRYRSIPPYEPSACGRDSLLLQTICDEENADIFISTYYSMPVTTSTIMLLYDMIPEILQADLGDWQEKVCTLMHASQYVAISENTARDFRAVYPLLSDRKVTVAYCGVSSVFRPMEKAAIADFRSKYEINKPYFCTVGERSGFNGYKNVTLFFEALNQLQNKSDYMVVCIGGRDTLEAELSQTLDAVEIVLLKLSDEELALAYSGAEALVYPSKYEGFGMPIAEAMACGCPVITSRNSSIPEVAGDAALYLKQLDIPDMVSALEQVQIPDFRNDLVTKGISQASKFSWAKMANIVSSVILNAVQNDSSLHPQVGWLWNELRHNQKELEKSGGVAAFLYPPPKTLEQSKLEIEQRLSEVLQEISLIEQGSFWKLRQMLISTKEKFLGGHSQPDFSISYSEDLELQLAKAQQKLSWMKTSKFVRARLD